MFLSPLVAMAADCEIDNSSGLPEIEAPPPPITNPAPFSSIPGSAQVAQETPRPEAAPRPPSRTPSRGPPLPVLRFPKVSRGRGYIMGRGVAIVDTGAGL